MVRKSFRNLVDLTPWDKSGSSWMGLKRSESKIIGLFLILVAIAMMIPPVFPDPSDFINIALSNFLIILFGFSKVLALAFTYTIIPFLLFLLGIWIYPYNSKLLFFGYVNKLRVIVKKYLKKPWFLIMLLIISYFTISFYIKIL